MAQGVKSRTFRVSAIPGTWSRNDLDQALEHHGIPSVDPKSRLQPCPFGTGTLTAIQDLATNAEVLETILEKPLENLLLSYKGHNFVVDQHLLGLTVVTSPRDPSTPIAAEYSSIRS